jgi:hypothetical protein
MSRDEQIREVLEGQFKREDEGRQAVLGAAESLEAMVELLGTLVEEVKGLRQDVAAIKASMPAPHDGGSVV